jgi:hypothetical protein
MKWSAVAVSWFSIFLLNAFVRRVYLLMPIGVSDEQKPVARQIDHAHAFATAKGWTVADEHVYADDGISGAEFAARRGFCA